MENWATTFAFFAKMCGDVEDHATVLCSLLLGWGLDAYVAFGTILVPSASASASAAASSGVVSSGAGGASTASEAKPHCWVVSMEHTEKETKAARWTTVTRVTFWEPLTGQEQSYTCDDCHIVVGGPQKGEHVVPYYELHCLFRNDCFHVNVQRRPLVLTLQSAPHATAPSSSSPSVNVRDSVTFDLHDETAWQQFPLPYYMLPRDGASKHGKSPMVMVDPLDETLRSHPGTNILLTGRSQPLCQSSSSSTTSSSDSVNVSEEELEEALERRLRVLLTKWRSDEAMSSDGYAPKTIFDPSLELILQVSKCFIIIIVIVVATSTLLYYCGDCNLSLVFVSHHSLDMNESASRVCAQMRVSSLSLW